MKLRHLAVKISIDADGLFSLTLLTLFNPIRPVPLTASPSPSPSPSPAQFFLDLTLQNPETETQVRGTAPVSGSGFYDAQEVIYIFLKNIL